MKCDICCTADKYICLCKKCLEKIPAINRLKHKTKALRELIDMDKKYINNHVPKIQELIATADDELNLIERKKK